MEKVKYLILGFFVGSAVLYIVQILDIPTFIRLGVAVSLAVLYLLSDISIMKKFWQINTK